MAVRALRIWPYTRGRWRLASLLVSGDLGGGPSITRDLMPTLRHEVVRGRFGVAIQIRRERRYLSPYVFGDHEPLTSQLFAALLRRGDIAVDVGANFGWFTALFARAVGDEGRVVAFEPLSDFVSELHNTIQLNAAEAIVHVEACGLGEHEGEFVIHTFRGLPGGHASSVDLGRTDAIAHTCRISTLDNVLRRLAIGPIDLLKVDVEGGERDVLSGARETLTRDPGPIVHFEINQACLAARGLTPDQVFEPLSQAGYSRLWRIDPDVGLGRRRILEVDVPAERQDADYVAAKDGAAGRVEDALARVLRRLQPPHEISRVGRVALDWLRR